MKLESSLAFVEKEEVHKAQPRKSFLSAMPIT